MSLDKLANVTIRNAKPGPKPVRLADGGGLYLEISPTGGKLWRWKYRFGGKEKRLSVGTYPETTLRDARSRRDEARRQFAAGIDPSATRKAEKASRAASSAGSFEAVAREWHAAVHVHKVSEGHATRTLIRLEQDVFPFIGSLPVGEVRAQALHCFKLCGGSRPAERWRQRTEQSRHVGRCSVTPSRPGEPRAIHQPV